MACWHENMNILTVVMLMESLALRNECLLLAISDILAVLAWLDMCNACMHCCSMVCLLVYVFVVSCVRNRYGLLFTIISTYLSIFDRLTANIFINIRLG